MHVMDDEGFVKPTAVIDHDRCDGKECPQRAYLWATVNGSTLAYCMHHGTQYFDALVTAGAITLDLRHAAHEEFTGQR